jgi:imidazolonepropionase-like amidohydrolase
VTRSVSIVVAACLCTQALVHAGQAAREGVTVIRASAMIDVESGEVVKNAVVIVEADRIKAVGPSLAVPSGAHVIDLGNSTLLPGLIDAHTHLLDNRNGAIDGKAAMLLNVAQASAARRALMGAALGREMLNAGFTTVRDVGNSGVNGDIALRDAVEAGWVTGPRIVESTRAIAPVGGQFGALTSRAQAVIDDEYVAVTGVVEARRAVRQALYDGADCIKVIVNSGTRLLSVDEIDAIVEEAHIAGRKVAAHATTDQATRVAAQAGVDSIEHAYGLPDDVIRMMVEKNITLVPTDAPADVYISMNSGGRPLSTAEREQAEKLYEPGILASRERLIRAFKAGVRIGAGSDIYIIIPGETRGQASLHMLTAYSDSGMPPLEILRAVTMNDAELLGRADQIGSLKTKKLADIIAVPGSPLDVTLVPFCDSS